MFYRDSENLYRAEPLDRFEWLRHGFGTRWSAGAGNGNLATLRQIHSDICFQGVSQAGCLGEGDALVSSAPGILVGVKTADCVPILLADETHRRAAAVHAGWRGTAQGIARKVARALVRPDSILHAAIGPAIGPCCYEVGSEVAERFGQRGRIHLDLVEENRRQLVEAGIAPERIYAARFCTACLADEFHSFRRDRERSGRMISFIGIEDACTAS